MAYISILAAKLSQFGKTEVEYNLVDDAGIMPKLRIVRKIDSLNPTPKEVDNLGQAICVESESSFLEQQLKNEQEESDKVIKEVGKVEKESALSVLVEEKLQEKRATLMTFIEEAKLNEILKNNLLSALKEIETITSIKEASKHIEIDEKSDLAAILLELEKKNKTESKESQSMVAESEEIVIKESKE